MTLNKRWCPNRIGWKNVRGRERLENLSHSIANSAHNCIRPARAGQQRHLQHISVPLWTRGRRRIAGGGFIVESRRHCERAIIKAFLCFKCYSTFPTVHGGVQKWAKSAHLMPSVSIHDDGSIIGIKLKVPIDSNAQEQAQTNSAIHFGWNLIFGIEILCQSKISVFTWFLFGQRQMIKTTLVPAP